MGGSSSTKKRMIEMFGVTPEKKEKGIYLTPNIFEILERFFKKDVSGIILFYLINDQFPSVPSNDTFSSVSYSFSLIDWARHSGKEISCYNCHQIFDNLYSRSKGRIIAVNSGIIVRSEDKYRYLPGLVTVPWLVKENSPLIYVRYCPWYVPDMIWYVTLTNRKVFSYYYDIDLNVFFEYAGSKPLSYKDISERGWLET